MSMSCHYSAWLPYTTEDFWLYGVDERKGEFKRGEYGDRYLKQGTAMFDFIHSKGF